MREISGQFSQGVVYQLAGEDESIWETLDAIFPPKKIVKLDDKEWRKMVKKLGISVKGLAKHSN